MFTLYRQIPTQIPHWILSPFCQSRSLSLYWVTVSVNTPLHTVEHPFYGHFKGPFTSSDCHVAATSLPNLSFWCCTVTPSERLRLWLWLILLLLGDCFATYFGAMLQWHRRRVTVAGCKWALVGSHLPFKVWQMCHQYVFIIILGSDLLCNKKSSFHQGSV